MLSSECVLLPCDTAWAAVQKKCRQLDLFLPSWYPSSYRGEPAGWWELAGDLIGRKKMKKTLNILDGYVKNCPGQLGQFHSLYVICCCAMCFCFHFVFARVFALYPVPGSTHLFLISRYYFPYIYLLSHASFWCVLASCFPFSVLLFHILSCLVPPIFYCCVCYFSPILFFIWVWTLFPWKHMPMTKTIKSNWIWCNCHWKTAWIYSLG